MNSNADILAARKLTATVVLATVLCATLVAGAFVCMHDEPSVSQAADVQPIDRTLSGTDLNMIFGGATVQVKGEDIARLNASNSALALVSGVEGAYIIRAYDILSGLEEVMSCSVSNAVLPGSNAAQALQGQLPGVSDITTH